MKVLYAMITKRCNLSCPHCDIKRNQEEDYDLDLFLKNLKEWGGYRILFGGEPSIVPIRAQKALPFCDSISTNLVNTPPNLFYAIKEQRIPIATSWNPQRFTKNQYQAWLMHVEELSKTNEITCLITLTSDLIEADGTKQFYDMLSRAKDSIFYIQFEQLHDPSRDQSFYDRVDEWLVSMYHTVKDDPVINKFPQFQPDAEWRFDCSQVYTMYPDGSIHYGCPEYTTTNILQKCYQCKHVAVCQPCRLQFCCTRPNKLFEAIKKQ